MTEKVFSPKGPFTVKHDGVGWSIYRGRAKQYQFKGSVDDTRSRHEAGTAKHLMNIAFREGRGRTVGYVALYTPKHGRKKGKTRPMSAMRSLAETKPYGLPLARVVLMKRGRRGS